jgi:hypothetical protein
MPNASHGTQHDRIFSRLSVTRDEDDVDRELHEPGVGAAARANIIALHGSSARLSEQSRPRVARSNAGISVVATSCPLAVRCSVRACAGSCVIARRKEDSCR